MGLRPSSDWPLNSTVTLTELKRAGVVVGHPSPYSLAVQVGPCEYLVSTSGVGTMSAEHPYEDAPRDVLESSLARQAAQIAKLLGEQQELGEVIAMQMDLLAAKSSTDRPLPSGGAVVPKTEDDNEWFQELIFRLQTYLSQRCGSRAPLHIADVALRNLVSHILD